MRPVEPRYLGRAARALAGAGGAVALPRSTQEVAVILRACAAARVGVVPWGGGTGLVGGQLQPEGPLPLLLSLERMAAVRGIYPDENVLVVEAGMVLADVQAHAASVGRLFPLSLAARGHLSDRRQPCHQRGRAERAALWQRQRSVSGDRGGAAGWHCFQWFEAAAQG